MTQPNNINNDKIGTNYLHDKISTNYLHDTNDNGDNVLYFLKVFIIFWNVFFNA